MGIYIKGMEMPDSCFHCPFLDYEEGFCLADAIKHDSGWYENKFRPGWKTDGRHESCPLVLVQPHGDLIDRDTLVKSDRMVGKLMMYGGEYVYTQAEIDHAPTIIPADESNMDSFIRIFEEDDEENGMDSFIRILKD